MHCVCIRYIRDLRYAFTHTQSHNHWQFNFKIEYEIEKNNAKCKAENETKNKCEMRYFWCLIFRWCYEFVRLELNLV